MTAGGSATPGWYPDPHDPTQLRYWDGVAWTEAQAPAAGAQLADHGHYYGSTEPAGSGLGDLGSWLSATFSSLVSRLGAVAALLYAIPVVGWIVVALLLRSALSRLSYDRGSDEFTGFDAAPLVVVGIIVLLLIPASIIGWLGAQHQLYAAHAGQPQPFARSVTTGMRRLPRTIGWGLVYVLAVLAALIAVGAVIGIGVAAVGAEFLLILLLVVPLAIIAVVYLAVRLSFSGTALAVAPSGVNPFRASWSISRNRFWPVLGRLLLLWIIIWIVSFITQSATQIGGAFLANELNYEFDSVSGEFVVDGQVISELDVIEFETFLPSAPIVIVITAVYLLSQAITQSLSVSGSSGLYYRGGGPAEL